MQRKRSGRPANHDDAFGIGFAARVSGLTPAMVDYLTRSGLIVPTSREKPGRGRARLYSFRDLVLLRTMAQLLKAGISVSKLRKALQVLREQSPAALRVEREAAFLVTDGSQVYYRSSRNLLHELTRGQFVFRFLIELAPIREHVSKQVAATPRRRTQRGGSYA